MALYIIICVCIYIYIYIAMVLYPCVLGSRGLILAILPQGSSRPPSDEGPLSPCAIMYMYILLLEI